MAHRTDDGNWKIFRNFFFGKTSLKKTFEWHSYQWGYGGLKIGNKKHFLNISFHRKSFYQKFFWLVWNELSMGVHTNEDEIEKKILEWMLCQESVFSKNDLNNTDISGIKEFQC